MSKYLIVISLFLYGFTLHAQNEVHDWGIGVNAGLFSYSALLESKLTNPYEYSIGASLTVSRYLNNHFDLTIEGIRTSINYPVNPLATDVPIKYENTYFYGGNFTFKYKIDNGYMLKEHIMFAPYLVAGGGAYITDVNSDLTYVVPVGLGVNVNLGDRTSLIFESNYNRDISGELSYMQYSAGLKLHLGKANKKRLRATKKRERDRHLAKIRKYREEQRIAQAREAKEKLQQLQSEGLVSKVPSMEADQDLLLIDEEIALSPSVEPGKVKAVATPPSKPKESSITKPMTRPTSSKPEAVPVVPESPGRNAFEENKPVLADSKPTIPKPKPTVKEEATTNRVEPPVVISTKPKPAKPKISEVTAPILKPTTPITANEVSTVETPQHPEKVKPVKITERTCRNKERELSELGENIIFDKNRSRVRSSMHWDLRKIFFILDQCKDISYVIIAHTDSDGNADYNRKLSAKRAEAVKEYLVSKGIESSRLITIPYGSSLPIVPNTSEDNKAKNRRIEFRLNRTSFED